MYRHASINEVEAVVLIEVKYPQLLVVRVSPVEGKRDPVLSDGVRLSRSADPLFHVCDRESFDYSIWKCIHSRKLTIKTF